MKNFIDFRSDTVTLPTEEMREAMFKAEVGDDVFGEDPTINLLEKTAAEIIGKEEALFVASGTMGNQVAVLAHTNRGEEIILDKESHIPYFELGAPAMFAGVQLQLVEGLLEGDTVSKINQSCRDQSSKFPTTSLVCLENTFNLGGGTIMPPEKMKEAYETAKSLGLKLHLDGARVFNASVALGCDVKELTGNCDTVQFCLSKGLSAPIGSILAGSREFIAKARKYRKALGGGMRQAGVVGAAGLIALTKMVSRLAEDHENARLLAEGLRKIPGIVIDLEKVQTNIIFVKIAGHKMKAAGFVNEMAKHGVKAVPLGEEMIRFVTHKEISREDVLRAVEIAQKVVSQE